jgi:hypothetical protein
MDSFKELKDSVAKIESDLENPDENAMNIILKKADEIQAIDAVQEILDKENE